MIRTIVLLALLSLVSCQRDGSGNPDSERTELPATAENNEESVLSNPEPMLIESEGFLDYGSPIEVQANENQGDLPEGIIITESRIEMPVFRTQPDKSKQEAEQVGTGQPATRPESKSEGSDKPQPEAEGRSR